MAETTSVVETYTSDGTGDHVDLVDYEIVERKFAIYTITIKLTWDGKFVEILNIRNDKNGWRLS